MSTKPPSGPATPAPLPPEALRRRCDPAELPFKTTAELDPLSEPIGQSRAAEAVRFGLGIQAQGYNLFAMGPAEMGKDTLVRGFIEERASGGPVPDDFVYVNNFNDPQRPRALRLQAGKGQAVRRDIKQLIEELRTTLPAAFEGEELATHKQMIEAEAKERHEKAVAELKRRADARGVAVVRTPVGFAVAPQKNGEVISPDDFEKLPEEERKGLMLGMEATQSEMRELLDQVPKLEKEVREKVKALLRDVAAVAVGHLIDALKKRYAALEVVTAHLAAMQQDILENVDDFVKTQDGATAEAALAELGVLGRRDRLQRYEVNVLVDHGEARGAPIVCEDHPTFQNLVGRVEHVTQLGALTTNFSLIRAGALHRANGGYLLLDARSLLLQPYAYEGLKRALRGREIRIESLGQMLSIASTVSLEPEPIPLDVKVVLLGERMLYYLLDHADPEFHALFKVAVDFEDVVPRDAESGLLYGRLVAQVAQRERLRAFDRDAVAALIEHGARLAEDAERLSTHMGDLTDLLREADYWAGAAGRAEVRAEDMNKAILAQEHRLGRVRERILEEIHRGTLLIDTRGAKVGQVNGLSVHALGRASFGRPSRITARTRLGKGEVIDIEREVQLGGPIHSKGVLILAGYLGARYATSHPLSLSATLVFEQSYGAVDGDSASCAELYALLSALAGVPLAQSFAVTGSVNQHGEVQPIGGVNEKIEGFFEVCKAEGLTGDQGVLIPASNVKHLMLSREVVEAAREGMFRVIPVRTIDEGIAILSGIAAGERDAEGVFPPESINGRVEASLIALAERRIHLARAEAQPATDAAGVS